MPKSKSGKFFANPQQARARDLAEAGMPKPAPMTRPGADDDAAGGDQPEEITIRKTPTGFQTEEPGQQPEEVTSFDEAMQKAKECLGVEADSDDSEPGAEGSSGADEEAPPSGDTGY